MTGRDDAKDRLRRYLEQRRDLGESELVLDGMTVEEVMRLLGTQGAVAAREAARETEPTFTQQTVKRAQRAAEPSREPLPAAGARESKPMTPAEASGDWRAALRAAGGAPMADPAKESLPGATEREIATGGRTPDRARDQERAAPRAGESLEQAGMEESPAPGAATPEAAEGARAPAPARAASVSDDWETGLTVGARGRDLLGDPIAQLASLGALADVIAKCQRCPLYSTAKNAVPGEGNPDADLVCVGEAPGQTEDETGRPFVGQAGQLLTKILAAINLAREDVFIVNVLKHRPPGNRNPRPEEVEACSPYLVRQLELSRPRVIVAFGTFAAQTLLNTKLPIGQLRAKVHHYYGTPLVATYHPAALLRNPAWKRPTWEDVQLARRILDRAPRA